MDEKPKDTEQAPEREADPAENPPPRGNEEIDEERLERDLEDLDRTGAN